MTFSIPPNYFTLFLFLLQRDLAARNVLLNYSLNAKVADFGLANRIYMRAEDNQFLAGNKGLFPFRWAAYETLENGIAIREKSDVWSFGIFMWELFYLCDALPYADLTGKVIHHLNINIILM